MTFVSNERIEEGGQVWWRLTGEAETWSTCHRGKLPGEDWKFSCCKFFVYPCCTGRANRGEIYGDSAWLVKAGHAALAGIRFARDDHKSFHNTATR